MGYCKECYVRERNPRAKERRMVFYGREYHCNKCGVRTRTVERYESPLAVRAFLLVLYWMSKVFYFGAIGYRKPHRWMR